MRYLCVDLGKKRTGIAICDAKETIASPYNILEGQEKLAERILQIIKKEQAGAVVVGLPLNMDDTEGGQAKISREFGDKLKKIAGDIEIIFFDERLSSFDAEDKLSQSEMSRKKKKARLDAIAAASILQSFLENKKNNQAG